MKTRFLAAAALSLAAACAAAQDVRIGYVDTRRIEAEAVPFVRALQAIKQEFAPREQQLVEFQKQINADRAKFDAERDKLPPEERQRRGNALASAMTKSDHIAIALAEDLERRKREALGPLISDANAAIKAVAEAGKFDLVLQQATYISPGLDITDQVLKEMAKRSGGKP